MTRWQFVLLATLVVLVLIAAFLRWRRRSSGSPEMSAIEDGDPDGPQDERRPSSTGVVGFHLTPPLWVGAMRPSGKRSARRAVARSMASLISASPGANQRCRDMPRPPRSERHPAQSRHFGARGIRNCRTCVRTKGCTLGTFCLIIFRKVAVDLNSGPSSNIPEIPVGSAGVA